MIRTSAIPRPPPTPAWPFWAAAGVALAGWLGLRPALHGDLLFAGADGAWAWCKALAVGPLPQAELELVAAWLLGLSLLPLAVGALLHWRVRHAWLAARVDDPLPAIAGRAIRETRELPWRIAGSYGLHVGIILFLLLMARGCAQRLGPPGGGGGPAAEEAPQEVQEVKIQEVRRRKLIVNPNSAIILKQPDEVQIDLREATRQEVRAQRLGGAGQGPGAGYEGGQGEKMRFVVLEHGGRGWDDANAVAAPNLLREIRARIGVPTAVKPDTVSVADLAAQDDPDQQPPVLYLCLGSAAPSLSASDHAFLRRYTTEIGGLILCDDTGGGRHHAEQLAQRLFPGLPFVALPLDDRLFNIRENMSAIPAEQRALARHGGDRIMGVSDGKRWLMIYHPGDLVDGWRGAYGQRWQETAYRFGVNVFHYATVNFTRIRAAEREKKRNAP